MRKSLTIKPTRTSKKPQFSMNKAGQRRVDAAFFTLTQYADKEARRDDKTQREARLAFAETFDIWLEWQLAENPEQVEETFFEFGCLATAKNRNHLLKHAQAPKGIAERIEDKLSEWKAAEEAAKAAAEADAAKATPENADAPA